MKETILIIWPVPSLDSAIVEEHVWNRQQKIMHAVLRRKHELVREFGLHQSVEHRFTLLNLTIVDRPELFMITDEDNLVRCHNGSKNLDFLSLGSLINDYLSEANVLQGTALRGFAGCDNDGGVRKNQLLVLFFVVPESFELLRSQSSYAILIKSEYFDFLINHSSLLLNFDPLRVKLKVFSVFLKHC